MTSDTDLADASEPEQDEKQELDLTIDIASPSACQRHVTVTVSRTDIDRYFDEAYSEMMPKANIPGFRPGRAPRKLVESHFRKDVAEQIKGSLLLDSMTQVTEGETFSAISEPDFDFDAVDVPEEGPLTFEFDIEVRPEFDMPKWKGLKLDKPEKSFTKADVDEHLATILERHAMLEPYDGAAEEGDYLICNMRFEHNGDQVANAEELSVRLRPILSFPDGELKDFDKLMKSATAGTEKKSKVTLSTEAYEEELRGEEVDVEIEVLEIKRLKLPELSEGLLNKLGGFSTEGEMRDAVQSELERQLTYFQHRRTREQITALLTESADWELPPELLKRQASREVERAIMELRSSGFSDEDIKAQENWLRQNSQVSTAKALKEHFILERIAEDEELEATDEDYEKEIQMMAMQGGESPRAVRSRIEKRGLMDALRNQIIERRAIDQITSQATFNEVEYTPDKAVRSAVDFAIAGTPPAEIPEAKHGGDERSLKQPVDRT
jgi:trigger factor